MRNILVAGGSGFLGANLCRAFLANGDRVVCIDNFSTGRKKNIITLQSGPFFEFVACDITQPLPSLVANQKYDVVVNLASPASPPRYIELAVETLLVGSVGTKALLDLAHRDGGRYVHASTSEVYGDPHIHPQPETYWGNVNSYGARSMYDESKRFAEAMIWVYRNQRSVNTGIIRLFNTYGPYMDPADGRVVSNFIVQSLKGRLITIYGKGDQTRSFCYASDQIRAIMAMVDSHEEGPINIGNPIEFTVRELAEKVVGLVGVKSKLIYKPLPPDDPAQRKPDISKAMTLLDWKPIVGLEEGLRLTIDYFRDEIAPVTRRRNALS